MDGSRASVTQETDTSRIAFGFDSDRNRELLAELLGSYDTIVFETTVPNKTDLCIVDAGAFPDLREHLAAWKEQNAPTIAPVLLVATGEEASLWKEYESELGTSLDTIQPIPAPKRAIKSRVEALLQTRKEAKLAAKRREQLELYERAMDGAEVGITIADADGDKPLVYANDGFLELTGYNREEALGRNCRYLQGPDTDDETRSRVREALNAEESVSVEILNYRKSGEPFWNELDIVPVTDGDAVSHFIGFQRDITARKHRQRILQRHRRIIQSVNDPIFVVDDAGAIEYANTAADETFGAGTTGTAVATLFSDEQADKLMDALTLALASHEPRTREVTCPDTQHSYQFRFQPETFDGDQRVIVVARDITDIRRQQERLSVLDRVLRHNLRNKLNVVTGHATTLTETPESSPEKIRETGERIQTAAESLLEIAEAVRGFGDGMAIDQRGGEEYDVAKTVRQLVPRLAKTYPEANVKTVCPESATALCPAQLEFCVDELIASAVERSGEAPQITVAVVDGESFVELQVHDDGETLPQVEQRALMAGAETPMEHTQGIALWLVRWAVEGVGGTFRVDSTDGTTITLLLPAT